MYISTDMYDKDRDVTTFINYLHFPSKLLNNNIQNET